MKGNSAAQPTLRMWRLFVLTSECGSITRAAQAGSTDQAYVSRMLTELERRTGDSLIERSKCGVKLTWIGAQRYREAKKVLAQYEALFLEPPVSGPLRSIRVAVPASLAPLFVRWIAAFALTHKGRGIRTDVSQYTDDNQPDMSGFDCYISDGGMPDTRVVANTLGRVQLAVVASKDFLKGEPPVQVPEDLEGRRLIAERPGRVLMTGNGQSVAISVDPIIRVNSAASLVDPARQGLGFAVGVPVWQVCDELHDGTLKSILPDWVIAAKEVRILQKPADSHREDVLALVQFLSSKWRTTPGVAGSDSPARE